MFHVNGVGCVMCEKPRYLSVLNTHVLMVIINDT